VVVGVRGRRIEAYSPGGRPLGTAPVGVGPTHVRAAPGGLFYVADTEGDAVISFRVTATGPRQVSPHQAGPHQAGPHQVGPHQVGWVRTRCCTPYGIAVDGRRGVLYVTLTASNLLESFLIVGGRLVPGRTWPTVRQPNDVAVDEATGRVFVAGPDDNQLQLIDPGS